MRCGTSREIVPTLAVNSWGKCIIPLRMASIHANCQRPFPSHLLENGHNLSSVSSSSCEVLNLVVLLFEVNMLHVNTLLFFLSVQVQNVPNLTRSLKTETEYR